MGAADVGGGGGGLVSATKLVVATGCWSRLGLLCPKKYPRHTASSSSPPHCQYGDKPLPGVANLGIRPTVGGTRPLLEVHLFDFDRDIYGAHISVRFVKKLRDEQRFPNFDALKAQIAADAAVARAFFKL